MADVVLGTFRDTGEVIQHNLGKGGEALYEGNEILSPGSKSM